MEIEPRGDLRVLVPTENMWLNNPKFQIFRKEVFLGIGDDGSDWSEVTEAEKVELEKAFIDPNEATKEDLYNALSKLGVE